MFSKISRYRKQPDVVTVDARGRALASKSLRLTPALEGDFEHRVTDGDRLDQLADTYFDQPRTWWLICDANPAILSPRALLGHEPGVTAQFPLTWDGPEPPWSSLLEALAQTLGVVDAAMGTPTQRYPEIAFSNGPLAFTLDLSLRDALDDSGEAQALTSALAAALQAEGVAFSGEVRIEQPGSGWRITDLETGEVRAFLPNISENEITVHPSTARYTWAVTVAYNRASLVDDGVLFDMIQGQGFATALPVEVGRLGKPIVIPSDATL